MTRGSPVPQARGWVIFKGRNAKHIRSATICWMKNNTQENTLEKTIQRIAWSNQEEISQVVAGRGSLPKQELLTAMGGEDRKIQHRARIGSDARDLLRRRNWQCFSLSWQRAISLASWSAAMLCRFWIGVVADGSKDTRVSAKAAEHRRTPQRGRHFTVFEQTRASSMVAVLSPRLGMTLLIVPTQQIQTYVRACASKVSANRSVSSNVKQTPFPVSQGERREGSFAVVESLSQLTMITSWPRS
jgi:hypothetical protein